MIASTLFRLLYSSGIRTTEARLLRCCDVDLASGILSIRQSKGAGEHFAVLHDSMAGIMRRYDVSIEEIVPRRVYFFPKNMSDFLPAYWITRMFHQIADRCGICDAVPYDLRHHYAITNVNSWINEGVDANDELVYLSKSMGHSSTESTRYYYALTPAFSDILQQNAEETEKWLIPEAYHEPIK